MRSILNARKLSQRIFNNTLHEFGFFHSVESCYDVMLVDRCLKSFLVNTAMNIF